MSDLGLRYFQAASTDRASLWHKDAPWSIQDWAVATLGELGEAANIIKKMARHRDGIATDRDPSVEELTAMLAEELADTQAYLVLLAQAAGIDLAGATVDKFNAVSARQGWEQNHSLDPLPPTRFPADRL